MNEINIIQLDNKIKSSFIEWHNNGKVIFSRGNKLYISNDTFTKSSLIGQFPTHIVHKILSKISIFRRILRYYFYNVYPIDEKRIFITFRKNIGILENGIFFPIKGLIRPARFLRNACAYDSKGGVYFGEYIPNPNRDSIHIYYLPPKSYKLEIVHTFKKNTIRHVHGIYKDPYSSDFWVLTGDVKKECKILKTTNQFKSLQEIGSGNENWRAVSIQFTKSNLYFATDAEFNQNYIFKMSRKTFKIKSIAEIDGPVYYSTKINNKIIFSVTAEGCPSQKENKAVLWKLNKNDTISKLKYYDKDIYPIQFMPGTIHLSNTITDDYVYGYGIGLKGLNHKSIKIQC